MNEKILDTDIELALSILEQITQSQQFSLEQICFVEIVLSNLGGRPLTLDRKNLVGSLIHVNEFFDEDELPTIIQSLSYLTVFFKKRLAEQAHEDRTLCRSWAGFLWSYIDQYKYGGR
jgi:hypothetical protein